MADNNFVNIKIKIGSDYKDVTIEKGVSFENNGAQYVIDKDGKLYKFDKSTNIWGSAKSIEMTNYQYQTFKAIANNDKKNGLSKEDIKKAMEQYSKGELTDDLKKELPSGYTIEKHETGNTNRLANGVEIGVAYNDKHAAGLKFEIASNDKLKQATQNTEVKQTQKTEKSNTDSYVKNSLIPEVLQENIFKGTFFDNLNVFGGNAKQYENVEYIEPEVYTVQNGDTPDKIRQKYGIDFFEFFAANPNLKYKVEYSETEQAKVEMVGYIHPGQKLNIPARYKIKPGSVKNIDDVIKATGVTREYIEDILLKMEPKVPGQPDLKAYYDKVNGKGVLTIGFGHTGRYLDNQPLTEKSTITEAQAYEILAQDILNNKVRTIAYFEQNGISRKDFNKIPESLKSVIVDIAFNKGIFDGFENKHHDYTSQLIKDLHKKNYAMATIHTNRISNVVGLEKRSMYRLICAMNDLSAKDKKNVINSVKSEMKRVIDRLKINSPTEADLLKQTWTEILKNN